MVKDALFDDFKDEDESTTQQLNFWKYRENPEVIGRYVRTDKGQYGDIIVLEVAGEEVFIPNTSALKTKLANLSIGNRVKILYKGEIKAKSGGRMYGDFKVWVKEK